MFFVFVFLCYLRCFFFALKVHPRKEMNKYKLIRKDEMKLWINKECLLKTKKETETEEERKKERERVRCV